MTRYFSPLFKLILSRAFLSNISLYKLVLILNKLVPVFQTFDLESIPTYFLHLPRWLIFTVSLLTVYSSLASHIELDPNEPNKANSNRVSIAPQNINRYKQGIYICKLACTPLYIEGYTHTNSRTYTQLDGFTFKAMQTTRPSSLLKAVSKSGALSC